MGEVSELPFPFASGTPAPEFSFEIPDFGSGTVFVVDDDPSALELTRTLLSRMGYRVTAFGDPEHVLAHAAEDEPMVLVTDWDMPGMNGLELAVRVQEREPDVGIILLTGSGDESTAQGALRIGAVDYLTKPPDPDALMVAVQKAFYRRAADDHHRAMVAWMKEELDRKASEIREVTISTLSSLVNALDARSPHFRGHSRAVAMQAAAIAQAMGLDVSEVESIRTAGLLHDVGMIAVPDSVVEKPEALTEEEVQIVRLHCTRGMEILQPMQHLGPILEYIHEHHERWDGSGYPQGKREGEVSLGGQIVGIAETWTALLESRAYRAGRSREEGLALMEDHKGAWFSEEVTDALIRADVGVI